MPSQQDSIQKLNKHTHNFNKDRGTTGSLSGDNMWGLAHLAHRIEIISEPK